MGGRQFNYLKTNANSYNDIVPFRIGLCHHFGAYCPIPPTHELWYDCPRQSWRFLIRCAEHHPLHKGGHALRNLYTLPFNRTRNCVTWRAAESLPYSGWGYRYPLPFNRPGNIGFFPKTEKNVLYFWVHLCYDSRAGYGWLTARGSVSGFTTHT